MSKKNILILGVGGTGSNAVDMLYQKIKKQGILAGNDITAIVFDTDVGCIEQLKDATKVPLSTEMKIGEVCKQLGAENIQEWFPTMTNQYDGGELHKGASQWRKKSFLALNAMLNDPARKSKLDNALNAWIAKNPKGPFQVMVVASIAGGTGSGSFIPLTLYVKNYLRTVHGADSDAYAMVACPDIYAEHQEGIPGAKTRIYANAYAIIRELNAMNMVTNSQGEDKDVHFRLGTPNAPTGVLFDSESAEYQKPERTPFKYVYLMDKLLTCGSSIQAHDSVLSNSLYSLLCTEAGDGIDSLESNLSKRPLAIYGGLASAQMEFPLDAVLDYAAHQKALDSIQKEWMILHNMVEEVIEKEREEAKRTPGMQVDDSEAAYALRYLDAKALEDERTDSPLTFIFEEALNEIITKNDGTREVKDRLKLYTDKLKLALEAVIKAPEDEKTAAGNARAAIKKPGVFGKAEKVKLQSELPRKLKNLLDDLTKYYKACDIKIKSTNFADRIFAWDPDREEKEYSIFHNLLTKDGKSIHPVAAVAQLCAFRKYLSTQLSSLTNKWIPKREEIPAELLSKGNNVQASAGEIRESYYMTERGNSAIPACLLAIANEPAKYKDVKTNAYVDTIQCYEDILNTFDNVEAMAKRQLKLLVLGEVAKRVDMLIAGYRTFFNNFGTVKANLESRVQTTLHKYVSSVGGLLYAGASVEQKQRLYKKMDAETLGAKLEGYAAAGKGVFSAAFDSALKKHEAEKNEDTKTGFGKSRNMYDTLFDTLIAKFKEILKGTNTYDTLSQKSILAVIAEQSDDPRKEFQNVFGELLNNAKPSLRVDGVRTPDGKGPSQADVIIISSQTADYLLEYASELGLADGNPSDTVAARRKSVAEDFFTKNVKTGVKIFILEGDDTNANRITMTSAILGAMPTEIRHFNEMAAATERNYFSHYLDAIHAVDRGREGGAYSEEMMHPHLGNDLHKRGHLPYICPEMETLADEKVSKAMLYAFYEKKITYKKPIGQERCFRCKVGSDEVEIRQNGKLVTADNLEGLFDWLRPQEKLVDEWCSALERKIKDQLENLPSADTDKQEGELKRRITGAKGDTLITTFLRDNLFGNISGLEDDEKYSRGILEFAYALSKKDARDAQMLIKVGYEIFVRVCAYRFNLKTGAGIGSFCNIANHENVKFAIALANDATVKEGGSDYAAAIMNFANNVTFTKGKEYNFLMADLEDPNYTPGCFCAVKSHNGDSIRTSPFSMSDDNLILPEED